MKKLFLFLVLAIASLSCDGETVLLPDDNPCPDWQIQVSTAQKIRLLNESGIWIDNINEQSLKLFSTDKNWNFLLNNDGEPENVYVIRAIYEPGLSQELKHIKLILGRSFRADEIDKKRGHYLLRINDSTYHKISTDYYTDCGDFILTDFQYNGKEYKANDWEIIDVVVD